MSRSLIQPSKSALPPAPSARDLEIYKGYVILQHHQCAIAQMYQINQSRISQIVGKVRRWLAAGGSPADPAIRDHLAQEQLAKATKRLRLMRIIEKATYASEARLESQVTTKSRYHGLSEVWREETRVKSPEVNLPALKLLLRAVKELDDLESRQEEPSPSPASPQLTEEQLLHSVYQLLCRWRSRAEAAGNVTASVDVPAFIADTLTTILGITFNPDLPPQSQPSVCANTPAHISASPEILVAPTTDQPNTCNQN
jgi:hypothetical protein